MTDEEVRALEARSRRNREARGQPIYPKWQTGAGADPDVPEAHKAPKVPEMRETKPKKLPKYRNTRTEVGGLKFDSKHEARVYQELMLRKEAGEIRAVVRQPKFDLPGGIAYYADFAVIYPDNRVEFWDAKSEITKKNRVYINKKKQVAQIWGIEIVEV